MRRLLVHPSALEADGTRLRVMPRPADGRGVGLELLDLVDGQRAERAPVDAPACVVVLSGYCDVSSEHGAWRGLGDRPDPFSGRPWAACLPPGTRFEVVGWAGGTQVAICTGFGGVGMEPRVLEPAAIAAEVRGHGPRHHRVHPILTGEAAAGGLLVRELVTPAGHWSGWASHGHDDGAPPDGLPLAGACHHRVARRGGHGLQRVRAHDRTLDETVVFRDGDVVLAPHGRHTVSAPPGHAVSSLLVRLGGRRQRTQTVSVTRHAVHHVAVSRHGETHSIT